METHVHAQRGVEMIHPIRFLTENRSHFGLVVSIASIRRRFTTSWKLRNDQAVIQCKSVPQVSGQWRLSISPSCMGAIGSGKSQAVTDLEPPTPCFHKCWHLRIKFYVSGLESTCGYFHKCDSKGSYCTKIVQGLTSVEEKNPSP